MRLTAEEIAAIKQTAAEIFGPAASVRLFGSRVDDNRRGGDIDLYLEVEPGQARWRRESDFRLLLEDRIGEQKIDVVLQERGHPLSPIARIALETGCRCDAKRFQRLGRSRRQPSIQPLVRHSRESGNPAFASRKCLKRLDLRVRGDDGSVVDTASGARCVNAIAPLGKGRKDAKVSAYDTNAVKF